jgi:multiple sugar transport system permease protein
MKTHGPLRFVRLGFAIILAAIYIFPLYWVIITSFKTYREAFAIPPIFFKLPDFSSYTTYFSQPDIARYLLNSLIATGVSSVLALTMGVLAAYALARVHIPGGEAIAFFLLASRFIPPVSTIIPLFLTLRSLKLFDTLIGLILVYMAMNVPYVVWMMRGFFRDLPIEVEEAAWIDGCSRRGGLLRVVLPMVRPGLAATSVLIAVFAWNDFLNALILTSSQAKTLPLSIAAFLGEGGIEWNSLAAAGTVIMLPAIIFTVMMQRHLAQGLTLGAVKG